MPCVQYIRKAQVTHKIAALSLCTSMVQQRLKTVEFIAVLVLAVESAAVTALYQSCNQQQQLITTPSVSNVARLALHIIYVPFRH